MKTTSENIEALEKNQIFVFGSNLAGIHGAGAARQAYKEFGAIWGRGTGLQGQTYAIPSKDRKIETLPLSEIAPHVKTFLHYAKGHPQLEFLVTAVGCGLAGYNAKDIAPMFKDVPTNVSLPESFWQVLKK